MITELLKPGRSNSTTTADLMELTGIGNVRALRGAVAKERRSGAVILSNSHGGYYLPSCAEDVADFIRFQESKVKSCFLSLRSAREYIKTAEGQLSIDEWGQISNE